VNPPRVLVVGSANVDFTVAAARLPSPGETVSGGTLLVNHGGKGANQAVAARRLGADVRFIGCVGADAPGARIRTQLAREGIGVDGLVTASEAATGTALIVVDAVGRNQIAVAPGANHRLTVDHLAARAEDFAWAEAVVCQLETPVATVLWALEEAGRRGLVTLLNPAPVVPLPDEVWPLVGYLTPNAGEAGRLSGHTTDTPAGVRAAARALLDRGPRAVIVTLGERGALVCEAGGMREVPAPAVDVVDTTAAGDAFNGALVVALGAGRALVDAAGLANRAAALACTRRGAQDSLPRREDVEAGRWLSGPPGPE
jgi:ribokinase